MKITASSEARRDLLHPATPLTRAIEVSDTRTGVDQVAADELDEPRVLHFPRHGRGRRLVQVAHPLLDLAGRHEREPVEREEEHLPGQVVDLARDREPFGGQRACSRRVVHATERRARTNVGEHPVLFAERYVLKQVAGPLEPAAGFGGTAEVHAVDRELEGETCCSTIVAEVARQPVAALVSFQRRRCVELRRRGDPETQKRVRGLFVRECSLELRPSLLPCALPKRRLPSFKGGRDLAFRHAFRVPKSTPGRATMHRRSMGQIRGTCVNQPDGPCGAGYSNEVASSRSRATNVLWNARRIPRSSSNRSKRPAIPPRGSYSTTSR